MSQATAAANDDSTEESNRKRPVEKFHVGRVHVSIFPQESSKGTFHTANFQLRYKDKNEEFQTGYSYSRRDAEDLAKAAEKAAEVIGTLDKGRDQAQNR